MRLTNLLMISSSIFLITACGQANSDYEEFYEDYLEDNYSEEDFLADLDEEEYNELIQSGAMEEIRNEIYQQRYYPEKNYKENGINGSRKYNDQTENYREEPIRNDSGNYTPKRYSGRGDIKKFPLHDQKTGELTGYVPLPSSWSVTSNIWTGPDQTHVEFRVGKQNTYTSVDEIIQKELMPAFNNGGAKVDRIVDLPKIARKDQNNDAQFWSYGKTKDLFEAKGIELTQVSTGNRSLIIVHNIYKRSQVGNFSYFFMHVLTSKARNFENDKNSLLYAVENSEMTQEFVANHNQREQQNSNYRGQVHTKKMRDNEIAFQGVLENGKRLSEIGDIYHDTYRNTSAMRDAGHSSAVNGIHEVDAMIDPYSGIQRELSQNYKYYFANQFGEYIGSNDEFYNPSMDPNVNNIEWKKMRRRGN